MSNPSPAERAVAEQSLLYRRYRAAKKQQFEELFAIPIHGPLLRKFNATLGHFNVEDADRMVEFVRARARVWLRAAPEDIKHAAVQLVSQRWARVREHAGLPSFDDPIPGAPGGDDVLMRCKRLIKESSLGGNP